MEQTRELTPEQDALEHIVCYKDKPFLEQRFIDSFKGRGVFTNKTIEPSTFVVEYRGIILCRKKPKPRKLDTLYKYLYEFTWKGAQWCTDASIEDGTLGRLVNDDNISPNCEMKKIEWEGKPHLCLFSVKKICPGEEITYSYGRSSYPWRSSESCEVSSTSNKDLHEKTPSEKLPHEDTSRSEEFCSNSDKISESEQSPGCDASDNESMHDSTVQEDEASEDSEKCSDNDYEPDEADLSSDEDNLGSDHKQKPKGLSITKKNFCYVCGKGMAKISRHLLKHADEEPDIAEAFALPINSKERKSLLSELRNRGNYKHNQQVLRTNSGDLKPKRRPTAKTFTPKAYVHCLYCKGMLISSEMWRHVARCPEKHSNCTKPGKTKVLNQIDGADSTLPENSQSDVWKLLKGMKQDKTAFVIQNDNLLLQLARCLLDKCGNYPHKEKRIKQRLREMGRLLLVLHTKSIFSFEDAVKPKNFYKIVETVKRMACFNEKKRSYKKPSLALKLGHSLKKISSIILNRSDNSNQTVTEAKTFMAMCAKEWNKLVSHKAYAALNAANGNYPSTIPFTQDVQSFYMFLEATSTSAITSMKMYESPQVYNALCRVTLAQAFVLNKGAVEVSRMTLKSFQESGDTTQVLSKNFIRINIPSKNEQNVAVLLTSRLVNAITQLVSRRLSCGVHKDNPYLFAKPDGLDSSLHHGPGCSRSFASLSNAKEPTFLRSTHFQKHIARIFQILNLENDELSHLAKLLGCDIRTDRDYYRSPEAAVDLAKIAKLLLAKEKGSLERFEGNSLDEVEIEDKLEPDVEKSSSKTRDADKKRDESDGLVQQSDDLALEDGQLSPKQDALEHITARKDKAFLEGTFIDPFKGRGVFSQESIEPSAFVVEYRGNLLTRKESKKNNCGDALEKYLFEFSWNGKNWCVDASEEDGSLGRLVNDDHISPNCEMKKVVSEGKPHLCLFALRKIFAGEEITYNYGDLSYPWRSTESSEKEKTSQTDVTGAASSPRNKRGSSEKQKTSQTDVRATTSLPRTERAEESSSAGSCCDDDYVHHEPSSDDDSLSDDNQQSQDDEEANLDENPCYTNKNYCYVCGKAQSKFARHLFTHREQEADIAQVFALPRRSKERKIRLQKLRNRGNNKHNQEVWKSRCGELKVRKRKNMPTFVKSCAPCVYCKKMYGCREMWKHLQNCSKKKSIQPARATNNKILSLVTTTVNDAQEFSADVKEILKSLQKDETLSGVWNDFYIQQLAQCLCTLKARKTKYGDLTKKLRDMGRLLVTLRKKSICSFEDALKPKNFSKVVESAREVAGFNGEMEASDRSTVVLRLGRSLKKMANIKYARALKEGADKEAIREAETFMSLCTKVQITAPQSKLKANNAPNIPFTQDVQLFYRYLEKTAASAVTSLTMYESAPVYIALLRVTAALVFILNKSAPDVSRVTLGSFNEREETELHEEASVCQSQFEQILGKRFTKIKLTSKCEKKAGSKKVVVMLTPELLNAITLLVQKREACGVHKNNPFLFARPVSTCTTFIQGQTCIKTLVPRCAAKNLENLRSHFFRKHMIRIFQILILTNDELGQLAKLLGRDIRTDREYYQMPEAAVDIAKILQLLSAMEKGSLERYEGKTLEEIEIEDELPPDLESDKPDGDNEEAESSVQSSGVSSPRRSISSTKNKGLPVRKRGRPRKRRPESESEECDQCEEKKTEEAEETLSRSKEEETNVYFSDDDDDYMNVNFDLDIDTDDGDGNYENDKNGNSVGLALPPVITNVKETANQKKDDGDSKKKDSSPNKRTTDREAEEAGDAEAEKQDEQMDVNRSSSSAILDAGVSSSRRSISSTKNKGLSVRKRGRPRKRRLVSEDEKSGLCEGKNENTPEENETEDMPVLKAEETLSRSKEDATDVYFSDDDDDYMNVDFDLDIDADEDDGNCKKDKDGDSVGLASTPVIGDVKETANQKKDISTKKDSSPNERTTDTENVPTDPMDVDSSSSSAILDAEKKNQLSAVLTGMKELKILIPKLNIENIQGPIHISLLPSVCRRLPVNDQPVQNNSNKCENTSPSTDVNNKSSDAKDIEMMCSYCKKCMTKGHTAYQKKGFKDVFCSKNCLFEMFPMNGQTTKTCHYCLKSITQLLDLIMAVVDVKGTMKDFCSATCLICFKSTTGSAQAAQLLCSMCNKSCTTTCELTLNAAVHKFCSDSCLEDFRRDRNAVCENCKSPCLEKLVLKLEGEPKTVCTERCLQHFKENIKTPAPCTLCHTYQPVPDMVVYKSSSDTMELFCSRNCVVSYRLGSALLHKLQGKKDPDQLKKKKRGMEMKQTLNSEDGNIRSDSTSSCPSERNPEIRLVNKTCYNCFQVVLRPHSIILAPVDDLGTMKELCSETCLASVNSRRSMAATKPSPPLGPQLDCRICNRYCYCKFRLTLEGTVHGLCSDTCLTIFRKANNVPLLTCDVCSSIHLDRQFELKMEDGIKNICSEECLVKFKEKVAKAQLCLMCQTSHQMSDMVENKNEEGSLSFFCSNRCMKVHQASFLTGTEKSKPSSEENEVKEVKPSPHFNIKEEPIDDEYNQKLSPSISMLDIKREPNAGKEDLKISSIFSLTEDSKPAAATFPHDDFHASCSNCKNILMDGETVYQRKGHTDVFCSTSCLFKFYQMKPVKKTCHFCLETITQPQDVVQAPVDSDGTTKGFCSQTCLSSFNYKKMMSTRMPIVPVGSHSQCNTCGRYSITKHEFIHNDRVYKMCSESCLNRFCNLNKLSICENCNSCCKNLFMLKVEHGNKKVCSAECLAHFKKKVKAHQPCAMCRAPKLISEMVENKNSKDEVELYCTNSCLMASKIQAISASGSPLSCDNCSKTTVPACHLAMSDDSMRNFCTLTCAMAFKETQKEKIAATNSTGVPDQTRLQPPEKLLCAQCQSVIGTTPKVIQKKDKVSFVCSLACSQKFKRDNNMTGMCAFCKNQRIITDTKRIDGKDCYFCSDGCKMLYREKLEMSSGRQCCQCAYCHSISTTVVTAKYDDKEETFCSEDCSSHFKMLVYCVAKCDTCGQGGKLRQYLPMLGHVKHFCDLKCLLHFCNKKAQVVDTGAPPPGSSSAVDSCPVIANVISLASALGRCSTVRSSPAHNGSVPDIQTKVVGHASVQTVPKELKNKSVLCTPLVHNKGVCCTTQTVDSEAQTDDFVPRVLPVPVPVYVPLPMNMYSQYTPKPVGLPLLLPVPVFFPVTSVGPEAAVKERIQPETSEGKSGMEITLKDEREGGQEGREMVKEGKRREYQTLTEHTSSCSRDLEKEDSNSFKNQEETCPNTTHTSHSLQHTDKESPLVSGVDVACEPQPGPPPPAAPHSHSLPSPPPAPPLQILGDVDNKSELQQMSKAGNEASLEHSKVMSRKQHKLKSQSGVDAWKRWIQWRTSKAEVGPSHAVKLKENMLHYSAAELSSSLCCFIKEVKRPDGKSYSPSSLFFLCLSIQQYLFENGRMENIFSDLTYTAFSTEFTKILKHFKPPVKTPGYIHSRVEEEYLWDCKQLGAYSPIVLLNTLLFFCCKYFGFATVERHRHLSFAHISRRTKTTSNNTKTTFLRFYLPVSVNEAEPDADGVPAKRRKKNENTEDFLEMMENTKNPLRCPVRLYEFYLSKCPESVRQHRDLFYLQPDRCCSPTSPLWFSSTPLDDSTMEAMLLRILTVRQLREGKGERRGMD